MTPRLALRQFTSQSWSLEWKGPTAVPLRFSDVVLPRAANSLPQTGVDVTRDTRGHSHDQRTGRYLHALRNDRPRRDHAPRSDAHVVEQDASHTDEAFVFHDAGMENDAVAHAHTRANQRRLALVHVDDGGVLEVRGLPNHDGGHVAAEHGLVPDARAGTQRNVAEHDCARRDEGGRMDYWRTGWNGHCTHASAGSPFF